MVSIVFLSLIFLCSWALCFLPQIIVYLPNGKYRSLNILHTEGASFLCFCFLRCSEGQFESSISWQGIARHEYCHQIQQRCISPFLLGILYFGEWGLRHYILGQGWNEAYQSLSWEKQARKYQEEYLASLRFGSKK